MEAKNTLECYVVNGHVFSIAVRQQVVDWMSAQHASLELTNETLHLSMRYLDVFLRRRGTEAFLERRDVVSANSTEPPPLKSTPTRILAPLSADAVMYLIDPTSPPLCNKLKRLGMTCMFVAAKMTEVCAPAAADFATVSQVASFTRAQLLLAERALLRELRYSLYLPTVSSFAGAYLDVCVPILKQSPHLVDVDKWRKTSAVRDQFSRAHDDTETEEEEVEEEDGEGEPRCDGGREDEKTERSRHTRALMRRRYPCVFLELTAVVEYVLELALVAHGSLAFHPSLLAAAAVRLAAARLDLDWSAAGGGLDAVKEVCGYTAYDLKAPCVFLARVLRDAACMHNKIRDKNKTGDKTGGGCQLFITAKHVAVASMLFSEVNHTTSPLRRAVMHVAHDVHIEGLTQEGERKKGEKQTGDADEAALCVTPF